MQSSNNNNCGYITSTLPPGTVRVGFHYRWVLHNDNENCAAAPEQPTACRGVRKVNRSRLDDSFSMATLGSCSFAVRRSLGVDKTINWTHNHCTFSNANSLHNYEFFLWSPVASVPDRGKDNFSFLLTGSGEQCYQVALNCLPASIS